MIINQKRARGNRESEINQIFPEAVNLTPHTYVTAKSAGLCQ
jgi:hypothetical protein